MCIEVRSARSPHVETLLALKLSVTKLRRIAAKRANN